MRTLALLAAAAAVACAQDAPAPIHFTLENGLRVTLRPLHGEQVSLMVLFDIGEDSDPEGRSGLAHLVEHLYVTCAAGATPARSAAEWFAAHRSGANAQTGARYTVVATVFAPPELPQELDDACARLGDLRIEAADLQREVPRLVEEVENMFGGLPHLAAGNHAAALVRPAPAGARKGGVPEQVAKITLEEARDRWKRFYKPKNARLVLAGSFDPEATRKAIQEKFGAIPAGETAPAPRELPATPVEKVARLTAKPRLPGAASCVSLAWAAPPPGHADFPAFLILANRVAGASSKHAAVGFMPFRFAPLDAPEVVTLTVPFANGESPDDALKSLRELVAQAVAAELGKSERKRVLANYGNLLGLYDGPEALLARNPYGQAFALGRAGQLGFERPALRAAIEGVTEESLRSAAGWFAPERTGAAVLTIE